jgi:hypothetical protein
MGARCLSGDTLLSTAGAQSARGFGCAATSVYGSKSQNHVSSYLLPAACAIPSQFLLIVSVSGIQSPGR